MQTTYEQQMAAIDTACKTLSDLERRYDIDLTVTILALHNAYDTVAAVKAVDFLEPKEKVS